MSITKQDVQRAFDAFNRHDIDAVMEFFHDECVFFTHLGEEEFGNKIEGKKEITKAFSTTFANIPDANWRLDDCLISENVGVTQWLFSGTDTEGNHTRVCGVDMLEFKDDKIIVKNAFRKQRTD